MKFSEILRQYSTKAAARHGGTPAAAEAGGVCIQDPSHTHSPYPKFTPKSTSPPGAYYNMHLYRGYCVLHNILYICSLKFAV